MIFCRLLGLLLCGTAATVYFASQSIRLTVVATLACSLLLQMVYFASVLFLIWRSSCAGKAGQGLSFSIGPRKFGTSRLTMMRVGMKLKMGPSAVKRSAYRCYSREAP
ncbi:exopolysaccharide production repressor protein [Mesorhizobium sp. L-2-11]|uniref:exopolysaccharide production repressor protein n=1 Tax=Mesorhizobium sp. L-2-11 TaxID=2744521 RepID=UPI001FD5BF40|nr:exopolysaccharide production repressor protein [Mesorhizobium sp. L-2-11]